MPASKQANEAVSYIEEVAGTHGEPGALRQRAGVHVRNAHAPARGNTVCRASRHLSSGCEFHRALPWAGRGREWSNE